MATRCAFADLAQLPATLEVIGEIKAGEKLEQNSGEHRQRASGVHHDRGAGARRCRCSGDGRVHVAARRACRDCAAPSRPARILFRVARKHGREVCCSTAVMRLTEAAIALVASVGKSRLQVYKRPRVAILTTGDEIVDVDATPGPTQIRNSNSYSLAAQILRAGGQPVLLPIAPDEPAGSAATHRTGIEIGFAAADRRRLHGTLRSGGAGAVGDACRVLLHRREDSARTPGSVWQVWRGRPRPRRSFSSRKRLFLWPARESRLDHGDIRTLRATDAGSARRSDVRASSHFSMPG